MLTRRTGERRGGRRERGEDEEDDRSCADLFTFDVCSFLNVEISPLVCR